MKIVFNRQVLSDAITPLMSAVSSKSTLAAIEGILVQTEGPNVCVLTTFDLEKGMQIKIPSQNEEEGACIVNAQKFNQTVRVMDGENITLEVDEKLTAEIKCGKSSHKMSALNAGDFPEIPNFTSKQGFVISQCILREMLNKVSFAMAVNDTRAILNGCYVVIENGKIEIVSCDSFKLAKCATEADISGIGDESKSFKFIIPTKTVNELCRMLSNDEEKTVTVYMSHKNMVMVTDTLTFFSRLINGEYIEYDRFIIKNHKIFVKAERYQLLAALERAALVTDEKSAGSYVKLEISENIMKILAKSTAGSTYDEITVEHEGDDIAIAFSNKYLTDAMRACSADSVKIGMTSPLAGINIEPDDGDGTDEFFMLLPVRMKE